MLAGPKVFTFTDTGATSEPLPVPGKGGKTVQGTNGNDALTGTAGNDVLVGGHGDDVLTDNNGSDIFVFSG